MTQIRAWAVKGPKEKLVPYQFDPGKLKPDEVEVVVKHCGICHSDLSVLQNDWGNSTYPCVLGHEVVGEIVALGEHAKGLEVGQLVGVGWNSGSCMHCRQCISGDQNLCPNVEATIIGHMGGFADRIRAEWQWVFPLPKGLDPRSSGPLMCGGITVFEPFYIHNIKPTDHVGIVGIGGLGHLAIQFAKAWGCEVTVFTHSASKHDEVKKLGADHIVSSIDSNAIQAMNGKLNMLLIAVNVSLDWASFIGTLAPKGRLHIVGVVEKPIPIAAFDLISKQRSLSGSPTGSPEAIATMLEFAARHGIAPQVEYFPMSQINEAFDYLKAGKPRYRIVLDADFRACPQTANA